jgi:hypothetical protein
MEYGGSVRINAVNNGAFNEVPHEMLALYGVGSGTKLSFVDMRQSRYGCLFAEGGQFLADHLVCQYGGESGGFDFTRGNQSKAQFLLVQQEPGRSAEGIGFKGPLDGNQLPPQTDPTVYNATACGTFGGSGLKDPYSFFMIRAPGGVIADFVGTGYYGGLQMTVDPTGPDGGFELATTQMWNSILFNNWDPRIDNPAANNISDPNPAQTQPDTDLTAWFNTPGWSNSTMDPNIAAGCASPSGAIQVAPKAPLVVGAGMPPNDGFFDSSATYIGAFRDSTDSWASGPWVVWSAK